MKPKTFSLTASHLRILALLLMLLDHLWATVIPGNDWMTYLGRMAFPIFAFQAAEGYHFTRDFRGYCRRLLIFGLISEIPFNLMISGSPLFPFHQNVMFTLLLGLLSCRALDDRKWEKLALLWLAAILTFPDYGLLGVLTVVLFHVFRGQPWLQLAGLAAINVFGFEGLVIPVYGFELPVQSFAVLAMVPLSLYRGERGSGGKWLQYGSYLFYPAHMLLLELM